MMVMMMMKPMNVLVQGGLVDLIPMNVIVQGGLVDVIAVNGIAECNCSKGGRLI